MRRPSLPDIAAARFASSMMIRKAGQAYRSFRRGLATLWACPTLISEGCNRARGAGDTRGRRGVKWRKT
ncbi:unnamed protein product [Ciceribacter sp. T2.26MG-112.2]|nr:unnamed protein product [Ciceribacter naphthalenivorans]